MYRFVVSALVGALGFVLLLGGSSEGQGTKSPRVGSPAATTSPVKFADFQNHLKSATFETYKSKKGSKVQSKAAFEKMRAHLLERHKNHPVKHTFLQDGHPIDCVPINQQPALQSKLLAGHKLQLKPPALPGLKGGKGGPKAAAKANEAKGGARIPGKQQPIRLGLRKGQKDKLGNEMAAPAGTIPIRRLTLDDLTRFRTLEEFQNHHSSGRRQPAKPKTSRRPAKLAGATNGGLVNVRAFGFQNVTNVGAQALLGLWQPFTSGEALSTSTIGLIGGNQEIEAGWLVNQQRFGTPSPVLYVAFGAGDGTLVQNLDGAGPDGHPLFVQTNTSIVLGGALSPVSTPGGSQHSFQVRLIRDDPTGNWWFYVGSVDTDNFIPVGYYPKAIFQSGRLSQAADQVFFGGRVIKTPDGFAQMGSGDKASQGAKLAASQSNCVYFPDPRTFILATLQEVTDDPSSYTVDLHNRSGTVFDTFLFFGGPLSIGR
jgi:hypothetical protein